MAGRAARILQGAREALAIAEGEADVAAFKVHVPSNVDVKSIRDGLGMTQVAFAATFGLSVRTVQEWEHGRSMPDATGRAYLKVIRDRPEIVRDVLTRE